MANNIFINASVQNIPIYDTVVYTSPNNGVANIHSIFVSNTSAIPVFFKLRCDDIVLFNKQTIPPNTSYIISEPITLTSNQQLIMKAYTNNTVSVFASIMETF